ncbi:2'-5' RNA ligase family protein [Kitasatospora sp. NRRL B-11411]|uniref:2'-5' RNA ligase family protein n=1 Tax=Kitasatospora sp. NRRL B-11411 TaxID=1463822 RepID=UPI0004C386F3|nr:2'-5' RNA ligase family protein [Kitasatospora sp. NRRL B-11411]
MHLFTPRYQGAFWVDGASVLHVYALPRAEDGDFHRLAARCFEVLEPYPVTTTAGHLHSTVEMIADTTSDNIPPAERDALTQALHRHLADVPAFEVLAGSPIVNATGALLDLSPDDHLLELRERVRAAIRETRGAGALRHGGGRPHATLAYAYDSADSDEVQSKLRRISPSHAPLTVDAVHLLDVTWQQRRQGDGRTAWTISWTSVATIPLAGPAT